MGIELSNSSSLFAPRAIHDCSSCSKSKDKETHNDGKNQLHSVFFRRIFLYAGVLKCQHWRVVAKQAGAKTGVVVFCHGVKASTHIFQARQGKCKEGVKRQDVVFVSVATIPSCDPLLVALIWEANSHGEIAFAFCFLC